DGPARPQHRFSARQCRAALRGPARGPAAELPAAVHGAVELASAGLPADRDRGRRKPVPVLRRPFRAGRLTRTLTVVQLLPALEAGGVERSTLEVAEALVGAGHRALVVSAGGRMLPALRAIGAEHIALDVGRKSLSALRHVGRLRRLFARELVDVVHARSRLPAWLAR